MKPGSIVITPQSHRFFRQLATAQAASAAYFIGHVTQAGGKVGAHSPGSFTTQLCCAHPVDILFDSSEVLGPISQGKWPDSIQLNVVPGSGPPPANPDPTAVQLLMGSLYEHAFITYFENNRALMKAKHGAVSRWPDALAFGRIVRHAFAHGGKVHIVDGSAVTWGNLTYSPAENGRRVLYNDLSSGDLTLLMIEMDSQF